MALVEGRAGSPVSGYTRYAIAIAKKVSEDGLDVRLKVHMCDDEEDKEGE